MDAPSQAWQTRAMAFDGNSTLGYDRTLAQGESMHVPWVTPTVNRMLWRSRTGKTPSATADCDRAPVASKAKGRPTVHPTSSPISASGIAYLFGDQFATPVRAGGETLPYSGVRVGTAELADKLYGVALLGLEAAGVIRLDLVEVKRLLGLATGQKVTITRLGPARAGGLEGGILAALVGDPGKDQVEKVVYRQIGEDMDDPRAYIVDLVRKDLIATGFLREERAPRSGLGRLLGDKVTLTAVRERIVPLAPEAERLRALLTNLHPSRPQLSDQLWKDIRQGFFSREKQDEPDFDD